MSVYFIQNTETKRIKIGNSLIPDNRLTELQVGNDALLKTIGVTENIGEKECQAKFRRLRYRGEWFECDPELLNFIKKICGQITVFNIDNIDYSMDIIDKNGEKWITRKQLADALGVNDLDPLHRRLLKRNEIKEGKHWNTCTVDMTHQVSNKNVIQKREIIIYSYHGVIRVAMASEGKRAIAFRDWVEDILYDVMTSGIFKPVEPLIKPDITRKKAADFCKDEISMGMAFGMGRRNAVIKAWSKTMDETGFDFSEYIPNRIITAQNIENTVKNIITEDIENFMKDSDNENFNYEMAINRGAIVWNNMILVKLDTMMQKTKYHDELKKLERKEIAKIMKAVGFVYNTSPRNIKGKRAKFWEISVFDFSDGD